MPDDLMVLGGEFVVKSDGTNQVSELPGSPLDSFAVQFRPAEKTDVAVAREFLEQQRTPRADVRRGLGGVSGWKPCKRRRARRRLSF